MNKQNIHRWENGYTYSLDELVMKLMRDGLTITTIVPIAYSKYNQGTLICEALIITSKEVIEEQQCQPKSIAHDTRPSISRVEKGEGC